MSFASCGVPLAMAFAVVACSGDEVGPAPKVEVAVLDDIELSSIAFTEGATIPTKYTCDAEDVSPPLRWSGVPEGAKSIALIADDPDAPRGTWVHWVLFRIPPDATELAEGVPAQDELADGARHGVTDFGQRQYGGPCPPPGSPHRYLFKLYALDTQVELESGATKKDLEQAMRGHILAQGQLMGRYQRR